jgi:hypothetical protein
VPVMLEGKKEKYFKVKLTEFKPFFIVVHQNDNRFKRAKYNNMVPAK